MAFRKAFTGGACNAGEGEQALRSNPLTNLMDNLIMGDPMAR